MPGRKDDETLGTITPLRGIALGDVTSRAPRGEEPALWFVTVTVSGDRRDVDDVRTGLERLGHERPFLVSAGYASTRAEVRYWDESVDVEGAVAQALRMWSDHERSAGLPPWRVVGLEVVDRETARRRWRNSTSVPVMNLGEIRALDAEA